MKTKLSYFFVVLALAILLTACSGTAAPQNQAPVRTINVTGSAQTSLAPDVAYISIGVHTQNADAREAVNANNTQANQIVTAITGMGVDAKDIRTSNFSISPQQQYDQNGQLTGTLYMVDNIVYVTLRDLTRVGDVISASVEAGANSINGVQFDLQDKTASLSNVRKAAVANARAQAEELAAEAGVQLGDVQSISFYNNAPVPVYADNKAVGYGVGGGSVPVSPGEITLTADVNIVYEIK
jgi:uncharacterized protein YggE